MANPLLVENLATDVISFTKAQRLGHESLEQAVAEPAVRTVNVCCKVVIFTKKTKIVKMDVAG